MKKSKVVKLDVVRNDKQVFREFVTGTAFDLTLKKTHILYLVAIAEGWAKNKYPKWKDRKNGADLFCTGFRGLERRGLAWHNNAKKTLYSEVYGLTRAGVLVCELIKEAGLYEDAKNKFEFEQR